MLDRNNVIGFMRQASILFMQQTIFTLSASAESNELAKIIRN